MIFKQETIKSWFSGVGTSVNNEVIQPFQNANSVISKYNLAIQHNSLTQQGWQRLLAQSDDSLKAYLTSIKGSTASMTGYTTSLQGNITGFKKVSSAISQYNTLSAKGVAEQKTFATAVSTTNGKLGTYLSGLNGAKASMGGYVKSLITAKAASIGLKVATVALNASFSMGISLLVSKVISSITEYSERISTAAEKAGEALDTAKSNVKELNSLIKEYNDLQLSNEWDNTDIETKKQLQKDINALLDDESEKLDIINGKYEDITEELYKQKLAKLSEQEKSAYDALEAEKDALWDENKYNDFSFKYGYSNKDGLEYYDDIDMLKGYLEEYDDILQASKKTSLSASSSTSAFIGTKDIENVEDLITQYDRLKQLAQEMYDNGDTGAFYDSINSYLDELEERVNKIHGYETDFADAQSANNLGKILTDSANGFGGYIETLEEYQKVVDFINNSNYENKEGILDILATDFYEFASQVEKAGDTVDDFGNKITVLPSISETIDNLNTRLKPTFDALKEAYQNIFKSEDGKINFSLDDVDISTFESIKSAIGELDEIEGIDIDYSTFDDFVKVLSDTSSTSDEVQDQFNKLATSIVYSSDCTEMSKDNFDLLVKSLYEMGLTNAPEVLKNIRTAQEELKASGYDLANITAEEAQEFINEAESSDIAIQYLRMYMLQKELANGNQLDTTESIQSLKKLCEQLGMTCNALGKTSELMQAVLSLESATNAIAAGVDYSGQYARQAEDAKKKIEDIKNGNFEDYNYNFNSNVTSPSSSKGSSGSSDSNKPSEVTQEFNWIEKYLESFARRTEKIMNRISDYLSFKKNISTIKSAIKSVRSELSANEQALAEYAKQMNAIGLDAKYIEKIKNGALEIETIIGYETDGNKDTNAQLIEKIEKYQDLYDKYTDIEDTIEDLRETEKEWLVKNLEYMNEYYQKLSDIKSLAIDKKQDNIDLKEAQGKKVTTSDYSKLVSNNEAYIKSLKTTYKKTNAEFNKLVNNGTIEKNSAEWFEWKETLADLNSEIVQAKINTAEWKGEINQIKIDGYTNSLDRLKAKHDKLNDAISKKKSSGVVVSQSDYNKVINNLNQQITKNEKLLALYKNLQSGTEKGSAKWLEYQELIEGTETEIASLGNSIIEAQEAINQLKIDKITSSLDRLEAKNEKLNDTISRKELSGIVANQSDYDNVIQNLNQQITKNEELLEYYKELQSQTKKNSEKWREYQKLIEGTESTVASLKNSIIETAVKTAGIIAEIKNLKLEDNENAESLLDAKYDNATSASERNKILDEKDTLAKSNYEINKQAAEDYEADVNKLGTELISYADKNISDAKSAMEDTSNELDKEKVNYDNYAVYYESAKERYLTAKTKSEKSDAKTEMEFLSQLMSESDKRIKALEGTLSSYGSDLKESQNILSQLESYEFGKEIDLSQITDKDLLEKASQYNETLKQQKQALIDVGLSEQEAIKILRENASKRIQNLIDEAEALDVLNQAMKSQIKSKMDLNKTQGYNISDVEYENYIGEVSDGINLLNDAYNKALAEFNNNLKSGVYEDNEELYLKDKANIEKLKASIYDAYAENESMLDEILQSRIDALNEEKEAIQKLYDLQERRYKLEEAQYNLEKAKQRTNLVYNGEEFVYQSDSNALKDAEKALEEAQYGELINKIDDWIEAMEDAKEDFNLYDADGNPLGSTEGIIKAAREFGDNLLDGLEKLLKLNKLTFNEDGEITKVQAFAEGGVVGKSDDDKFKAIAKSLGEDNLVAVKNGEMVLTKLQSNELYKKLVGTGTVPTPILDLKPVIPDNLVRVNTAPNVSIDMSGMQFNEVQNVSDLSKAIVNGQLRGAIKQGLGRLKV